MTSFSSVFMEAPGDCSPSRRVVSKMWIFLVMMSPNSRWLPNRFHGFELQRQKEPQP